MWSPWRPKKAGSDRVDRLIAALMENNDLLRAQMTASGIPVPPRVSPGPFRKRTESDVTVVTRAQRLEQQAKAASDQTKASPDVLSPENPS